MSHHLPTISELTSALRKLENEALSLQGQILRKQIAIEEIFMLQRQPLPEPDHEPSTNEIVRAAIARMNGEFGYPELQAACVEGHPKLAQKIKNNMYQTCMALKRAGLLTPSGRGLMKASGPICNIQNL